MHKICKKYNNERENIYIYMDRIKMCFTIDL